MGRRRPWITRPNILRDGSIYGIIAAKAGGVPLTKLDKLYAEIVRNPKDVRFEDLDRLLRRYGF